MKINKKVLITIGRQFGSGGRLISEALGEKLGIPVYDKNIISIIAKKHGYDEQALVNSDERLANPFFEPYSPYGTDTGTISEKLFMLQAQIIKEEADKGSCVFIGRCANDVLRNYEDVVRIFIYAPREVRIRRVMERENIASEETAARALRKADKARRAYYQFYTDKKWGTPEGMDLLFDSEIFGIDGSAEFIIDFLRRKGYVSD
ncbi:MAG: cytidylate kinase-like family protein [Lachnospiraceae bacterium]|nr:cytidylate kinase-like family protein [Lachnospiraceae bacterium]